MTRRKIYFDDGARAFLLMLLIAQLFLTNGIYLCFGGICFAIVIYNLQQPYKPSVFTLIFFYHFIQVSAGLWLSNYLGKDINYRSAHGDTAILVAYIGLVVLFYPIIYFQNKIPTISLQTMKTHADRLSIGNTFKAYIITFFITNTLAGIALSLGGLAQVTLSLVNIKWFFFLLFGFQAILKKRMLKQFYLMVSMEFLLGFFSYFSEFKTVLFFVLFLLITLLTNVKFKHVVIAAGSLFLLFLGGVFWSSIKGEYRAFLNKGTNTQTVGVTRNEALDKLVELSDQKDSDFDKSIIEFLDRIQYTHHLAKSMDRVPSVIPYQEGKNWGTTLEFVLTPRILNPDKPIYQASIKATKYTGIGYAGARSGTSVSLGYFADGYIDFGYFGMYLPLILIGLIYGYGVYYFVKRSSNNFIFNYAVVGGLFMEFLAFEMDSTFLLGRLFSNLLIFYLLSVFFFPWLIKQLSAPSNEYGKEY
ncbi:MAG: hypothetical protein ABIO04_09915 [Ferruginibacter sp.]